MRKGTSQTSEARLKISAAQRARHETRHAEEAYRRAKVHFYAAVGDEAPNDELIELLERLIQLAPADERARWERWHGAASRPGAKLRISVFPADVLAGDNLAAVEYARAELADDEALAEEFQA